MINNPSKESYVPLWMYLLFPILSVWFITVFSSSTSPFYIGYGGDSANYLVMGRFLLSGLIPYLDFFDHKGPMVIFIEAFGQMLISGRTGLYILQIINLSLTLFFFFKTARLFLNNLNSLTVSVLALFFLAFTLEGGNLTEEYSLLFLSLTLWLTCKFFLTEKIKVWDIFLIGISAAFLFWIRLNNMGTLCACSVFIIIVLFKNKDFKSFGRFCVFFLLGFLFVSIPLIGFYMMKGALWEMIDAAFIYNFRYIGINQEEDHLRDVAALLFYILKAWIPFIVLTIGSIVYYLKSRDYKIILFAALLFIFGFGSTHLGAAYYHYMTLNIPCLVMGGIFLFLSFPGKVEKGKVSLFVFLLILIPFLLFSGYKLKTNGAFTEGDSYYIGQVRELVDVIPENERDSVYVYQTMTRFFASSEVLLPHYKYFMMQEWQGRYNPQLLTDINSMMRNDPPKWVITQFRDQSMNKEFWEIVDSKFTLYKKNSLFELYKLNNQ